MSQKPDGGPAFPIAVDTAGYWGMSLREYFAGQALALGGEWFHNNSAKGTVAELAYQIADAMLEARTK